MTPERLRTEPLRSRAMGLFLERPANWSGEVRAEEEPQPHSQAPEVIAALRSCTRSLRCSLLSLRWVVSFSGSINLSGLASCAVPQDSVLNFQAGRDSLMRSHPYRRRNNTVAQ